MNPTIPNMLRSRRMLYISDVALFRNQSTSNATVVENVGQIGPNFALFDPPVKIRSGVGKKISESTTDILLTGRR